MDAVVAYATRAIQSPPSGREATYAFAGWKPTFLMPSGMPVASWEATTIARIVLPESLAYLDGQRVTKIACHAKVAPDLLHALEDVHRAGLWRFLEPFGGGYQFRRISGSQQLSLHALGLAVDFDPEANPRDGDPEKSRFGSTGEGRAVIRIMELYGWYWGGRFLKRPDAMHFQFARGV